MPWRPAAVACQRVRTRRDDSRIDYLVGDGADAMAVGDLDGNGRPDLVTANFEFELHQVSIYLDRPDRCVVEDVSGATVHVAGRRPTLAEATRALTRGNCRVGGISFAVAVPIVC